MQEQEKIIGPGSGSKTFRAYFFEFFMLFLAVFCGFLADNIREAIVDSQMEDEYIQSLVVDLRSDIQKLNSITATTERSKAMVDSLLLELSSPKVAANSREAWRLWSKSTGFVDFVSNDRTMQQLKNTGALRLIRNKAVSDSIMKYDQVVKSLEIHQQVLNAFLSDQKYYKEFFRFIRLKQNDKTIVPLTDLGQNTIDAAYADRLYWKSGLRDLLRKLKTVRLEAQNLEAFIRKEYDIES